jgi:uncharacterized protein (DUF1697 family)
MPKRAAAESSPARRFVAFLRAINVGKRWVKMEDLRKIFEKMGLSNVETFIQSGNVVFSCDTRDAVALERKIEAALEKALGYEVVTLVRSSVELTAVASHGARRPVKADKTESLWVLFLPREPERGARQKLEAMSDAANVFEVHGRELYWFRRRQPGDKLVPEVPVERILGLKGTARNITTVGKIAAKYCSDSAPAAAKPSSRARRA